jgi:uncharacterized protein with HEPN domain
MIKDDSLYLSHILISRSKIRSNSEDREYEDFTNNGMLQDAIIRQIEIIGEASKRITE